MVFSRRETALLVVGDFLVLAASLWLSLAARSLSVPTPEYFGLLFVPFVPIFGLSLIIFYVAGLYEKQTMPVRRVMGARVAGAQAANTVIAALLFFVLQLSIAPKTILVLYLGISVITISLWRFYRMSRETRLESRVPAVLVGRGAAVTEAYQEMTRNDRQLLRIAEFVDTAAMTSAQAVGGAVLDAISRGAQVVILDSQDAVVVEASPIIFERALGTVSYLEFNTLYEQLFDRVALEHVGYAWLLPLLPGRPSLYDTAKRVLDILASVFGLLLSSIFIVSAAAVLRLSGSAFIKSERVGKDGRTFRLFKLRTMLFDDKGSPEQRAKNKITTLGSFLRKSRIDELPQLWNVLLGDLSFIGPRPELPTIVTVYQKEIPLYQARHSIVPGLSGWAQIRDFDAPKGGPDVVKTQKKLSYDLYYLKHRSFGLDIAIMLKTLRALLTFSGK